MTATGAWTPAGGYKLEPNALLAATETERNVLVVAGPGAGKTEMLAQRADFLLRTGTCPYPRRILAISFKTDAAENLRSRVAQRCSPALASRLDSHTFHAFAKRLIDNYRVVLTGTDELDHDYTVGTERIERRQITFGDMVPLATEIVRSSVTVRNAIRNTYSHVFLDEFQDCTNVQYDLVRTAFGATPALLTAVGDTKQSIMRHAGALEGIFDRFASDWAAQVRYLYQNHRSAPRIRRVQNEMVKVMEAAAAVDDAALAGDEGIVELNEYRTCVEEAADIVGGILDWTTNEGTPLSDIAILVRQQVHLYARSLMVELDAHGVPYRNEQELQDDFAQPVGRLILDFLAVVLHTRQPDAYQRLMERLTPATGDDEVDARHAARWRTLLLQSQVAARASMDANDPGEALVAVVRTFLEAVGGDPLTALSPEYSSGDRLERLVESLLNRVRQLAVTRSSPPSDLGQVTDDGAVRILTIHKSKGLEFDSVVVLGAENETYWGNQDEARATFFVAVSRAKRRLVVTVAERRAKPDGASRWNFWREPHEEFLSYVRTAVDT